MLRRFTADLVGLLQSALMCEAKRSGVRGTLVGSLNVGDTGDFTSATTLLVRTFDLIGEHEETGLSGVPWLE